MIGHTFAASGATVLAVAPSAEHHDMYVVLARYHRTYVVANVLTSSLPAPESWAQSVHPDTDGDPLDDTVRAFAAATGLGERLDTLMRVRRQVEHAERLLAERADTGAAPK